jgi:DNA-binding LacI/PurR family transcriptional regulator
VYNVSKQLNLRQIARLARTSKSSVSRVLTNHPNVAPATRARIEKVIRKHGFRPNVFARGLAGGRTGLIAAITAEMTSGFYAEVLKGIDQVVSERGGHVLSSFAHGSEDYVKFWRRMIDTRQADGIILIAPPLGIFDQPPHRRDYPTALCACRPPPAAAPGWADIPSATVNNRTAVMALLETMHARGLRRIVYLAGPPDVYDANERRQAVAVFAAAHRDWQVTFVQAGHGHELGRKVTLAHLADHPAPEAFVCFNDATAYGALQALRERGRTDVLVTGCDDETAAAAMNLTTLHMPMPELGQAAARLLLERVGPEVTDTPARHEVVDLAVMWRAGA